MRIIIDWHLWYYAFLALIGILYTQQKNKYLNSPEGRLLKTEDEYRTSVLFSILIFLPLILCAGFRNWSVGNYFTDSGAYIDGFRTAPDSLSEAIKLWDWNARAPGFYLFTSLIKQVFGVGLFDVDFRAYFLIIAAICGLCLALTYRRYSSDVVMCAFLFFASTDFISWMENGLKQFLAASIVFAFFHLLRKKKIILFILIVLVMFTFHKSVLIVIPLYLASLGKPFNKKTIIVLFLVLLAIVFVGGFTNVLEDSLQGTVYSNIVSEFENDDGTNIIRAIVYSIPAVLAITNRKRIDESTPDIIKVSVNMSLFTMSLYFLSVFMSGIYMGRIPVYCSLFNYILLPWEIKNFFREDMHKILKGLMIILYFLFFVYQMTQWGV